MNGDLDFHAAKAMLLWQMELGADEAIGELPVNRYAAAEAERPQARAPGRMRSSRRGGWRKRPPTCLR